MSGNQSISEFLDGLKEKYANDSRKWWPNYIYHTTSIHNVVKILDSGRLLSRHSALAESTLIDDIADTATHFT